MPRYALLLRGINVGRAKRVAMADLRALLSDLGYTGVRTLLNSGNAVLTGDDADPAAHSALIEAAIRDRLGLEVRCAVLPADALRAIVDDDPFTAVADNGSRMMIYVYLAPIDPGLVGTPVPADVEGAQVGLRALYQWCPGGLTGAPDLGPFLRDVLRTAVTARNRNTITKLVQLL